MRLNSYGRRLIHRNVFSHFNLNNQFFDYGNLDVDLVHLFNGISYGRTPWVTSFETAVPRFFRGNGRTQGQPA